VHWEQGIGRAKKKIRKARGERRQVIRRRIEATATRISVINEHIQLLARAEADRRNREQQAEEAHYWQCFERLRRHPTEENAKGAKRAYLLLANRHHPDQGGKRIVAQMLRLLDQPSRFVSAEPGIYVWDGLQGQTLPPLPSSRNVVPAESSA
jgi:hypothetical protein